MGRVDTYHLSRDLPEPDRRAAAQRLQELGVTPIGAHQAMHGQVVSNSGDRAIISALIHQAVSSGKSSMNL